MTNEDEDNTAAETAQAPKPPSHRFQKGFDPRRHVGGRPKKDILEKKVAPTEPNIKQLARAKSQEAIQTLYKLMSSDKTPAATRLAAANALLDRGYGRPQQTIETKANIFESMTDEELLEYLTGTVSRIGLVEDVIEISEDDG